MRGTVCTAAGGRTDGRTERVSAAARTDARTAAPALHWAWPTPFGVCDLLPLVQLAGGGVRYKPTGGASGASWSAHLRAERGVARQVESARLFAEDADRGERRAAPPWSL